MGGVRAIAAAAKAVRQTGGVTPESWLSQKMIMCADSSAMVSASRDSAPSVKVRLISGGTSATSAAAASSDMGWPITSMRSAATSIRIALAWSPMVPAATAWITLDSAISSASAGAERVASTT